MDRLRVVGCHNCRTAVSLYTAADTYRDEKRSDFRLHIADSDTFTCSWHRRHCAGLCVFSYTLSVAELFLYCDKIGTDWEDPEDPTVIAENELLGAASSIDAAAKKLANLRPRVSSIKVILSLLFFLLDLDIIPAALLQLPPPPPSVDLRDKNSNL